ncbi:MAG: alpha/beta hydrolase [Pseudomonadota bacterium]
MMLALLAALTAVGLAAFALAQNAKAYIRRAEARWPADGRFIDADGMRLHVREAGPADAQRVLLIHGASANLRELWGPIGEALKSDHRVMAMDRPGYGYSTRPARDAEKLGVQASLAARVLDGNAALIVAHSLGCAVALRLALDFPELVDGLVLLSPASHPYPGNNAWWARLAAAPVIGPAFCTIIPLVGPAMSARGVANNFYPAPTPANYYEDAGVGLFFRPRAFRVSAQDVVATRAEFAAQAPSYPEILAHTIIITTDKDKVVSPQRHARGLARDLPAAELVIAPGAGHMPHRLRPDLVLAAIRRVQAMAEPADES